jgi:hypothetical protein
MAEVFFPSQKCTQLLQDDNYRTVVLPEAVEIKKLNNQHNHATPVLKKFVRESFNSDWTSSLSRRSTPYTILEHIIQRDSWAEKVLREEAVAVGGNGLEAAKSRSNVSWAFWPRPSASTWTRLFPASTWSGLLVFSESKT